MKLKPVLLITAAIMVLLFAAAPDSHSAVPRLLNYQGLLLDSTGTPLQGNQLVKFTIYNSADAAVWNSGFVIVSFVDGLFTSALGQSPQISLPADFWLDDTLLTLGVTLGVNPEFVPRTRLMASPFAFESNHADSSDVAGAVDWAAIANLPSGFMDGVDDNSVYAAGTGLALNGAVFSIPTGGVSTTEITDATITNNDIDPAANIAPSRISGTAATLSGSNIFTSNNRFNGRISVQNSGGLGLVNVEPPDLATNSTTFGFNATLQNSMGGVSYGVSGRASKTTTGVSGGVCLGVEGAGTTDYQFRYGVRGFALATDTGLNTGSSYGVYGQGYHGQTAYGVYGTATSGLTNWAGYFQGNAHVTGTLTKGGGAFRIDHPLDPENKILQHSFIESPDMMNIYNGYAVTDADGFAVVTLPDYFEALNRDFRYQLTPLGQFAQVMVAEEISGNRFTIRTDKPNVKVSWQVTGIRRDRWAEANRIQVELNKSPWERGLYLHHEAYNVPIEKSVDYESLQEAERGVARIRNESDQ